MVKFQQKLQYVEAMVKTAARLHKDPKILAAIEDAATSCVKWGGVLQSLFIDGTLDMLYVLKYDSRGNVVPMEDFGTIASKLRNGNAVLISVKLPGSTDHVFTVVGDGEKARVLHAWERKHGIRAERSMPIDEMVSLLEKFVKYNYTNDFIKLLDVRTELWGSDHRIGSVADFIETTPRRQILFSGIISGKPKKPLIECKETLGGD